MPVDPSQIKWVTSKKGDRLKGKIKGGDELGSPVYICRGKYNGNVYPGKYVDTVGGNKVDFSYIDCGGSEIGFSEWQIATGNENDFKWVKQSGTFDKFKLISGGDVPVTGGYEVTNGGYDLNLFYIARAPVTHDGKVVGITPGMVSKGRGATLAYYGTEYEATEYEVLVYSRPTAPSA